MEIGAYLSYLGLSKQTIGNLKNMVERFDLDDGQRVLSPPDICTHLYYIEEGIIREYKSLNTDTDTDTDTDTECTSWILGEGNVVYSVESYIQQTRSEYHLQALTKTKGWKLSRVDLHSLLLEEPDITLMAYKLSEDYILKMEKRNKLHRFKKLKDRLNFFEEQQPGISNRIKGKVLANYLNVLPQQLSKLRSDLVKG